MSNGYDIQFRTTDDADWVYAFECIDKTTDLPMDVSAIGFELQVTDGNRCMLLRATTDDNSITRPDIHTFQWRFTRAQMGGLCIGTTYKVGCRMTNEDGGQDMLFTGTLAFVNGGMAS